jgi:hypothetical protein
MLQSVIFVVDVQILVFYASDDDFFLRYASDDDLLHISYELCSKCL